MLILMFNFLILNYLLSCFGGSNLGRDDRGLENPGTQFQSRSRGQMLLTTLSDVRSRTTPTNM